MQASMLKLDAAQGLDGEVGAVGGLSGGRVGQVGGRGHGGGSRVLNTPRLRKPQKELTGHRLNFKKSYFFLVARPEPLPPPSLRGWATVTRGL